ncbi:transcription initiation factor IIF, beta subunit [Fistulina hepatica ATCC 64428]|nr:transcription initiation factor IIF, beta subunit [Fistulina hepatica ATCC 64428]
MDVEEDEKKPFIAETNLRNDDGEPDPDEELMLDQGGGRVWLVKIPKVLLDRWTGIQESDRHLASLRIWNNEHTGHRPRILLYLPQKRDTPQRADRPVFEEGAPPVEEDEPDIYQLEILNQSVENQYIFAERPKDQTFGLSMSDAPTAPNSRAISTMLTGRIRHEANLRPGFSAKYRRQIRERHVKAHMPKRTVRRIDTPDVLGGRGNINRLNSGVAIGGNGSGRGFSDVIKAKPKKTAFERMARIPRNQLLDLLFECFREQQFWTVKNLRERTQQPEAYLKETLAEVGVLHRNGEHTGHWELQELYRGDGVKAEDVAGPSDGVKREQPPNGLKLEEEEDPDEDEDEDMEEVS